MRVEVIQEDIDFGQQEQPESCALAEAIHREQGLGDIPISVMVGGNGHVISVLRGDDGEETEEIYGLTFKAMDFLNKFDKDKSSVKPDVFRFRRLTDEAEITDYERGILPARKGAEV